MLFSTLGMVLADELGTKEIWGLKGSGSWRPCALCANVVNARFGFEEHVTRDIVLHTETDPRKLKLHTDESVFAIIDKLQEASISKARCAELEKIHGFHHQPHGVLQCLQLRSVVKPSCISYDFMHCFLTNGVADYELQLYWRECLSQMLLTLQAMKNWMECFIWPQRIRKPKNYVECLPHRRGGVLWRWCQQSPVILPCISRYDHPSDSSACAGPTDQQLAEPLPSSGWLGCLPADLPSASPMAGAHPHMDAIDEGGMARQHMEAQASLLPPPAQVHRAVRSLTKHLRN